MTKGAPTGNENAVGHGLYASKPPRAIKVRPDVSVTELATYAQDLADVALWIAGSIAGAADQHPEFDGHRLIGLYATVAQELNQVAAELAGETGIKPAALGNLTDEQYDRMMGKQAQALELVINQCVAAGKRIAMVEEILGGVAREPKNDAIQNPVLDISGGLVWLEDGIAITNPVLQYLAGHMRNAKRMIRQAGANRAWKVRGSDRDDDLMTRMIDQIGG